VQHSPRLCVDNAAICLDAPGRAGAVISTSVAPLNMIFMRSFCCLGASPGAAIAMADTARNMSCMILRSAHEQ